MSLNTTKEAMRHFGHKLFMDYYGDEGDVAIVCEDCNEVLLSFEEGEWQPPA